MSKAFNVDAAQTHRRLVSEKMKGHYFKHYKGGTYLVIGVSVDESSGDTLITYRSNQTEHVWTRTHHNFTEYVNPTRENPDGVPRFQSL